MEVQGWRFKVGGSRLEGRVRKRVEPNYSLKKIGKDQGHARVGKGYDQARTRSLTTADLVFIFKQGGRGFLCSHF